MVLGILATLLGGFFVWTSVSYLDKKLIPALHARRNGVEAEGRVVRLKAVRNERHTLYMPEIAFDTLDGQTIQFLETINTGQAARQTGELVSVRYDPSDPVHSATTADGDDVIRRTVTTSVLTLLFCFIMTLGLLLIIGVI